MKISKCMLSLSIPALLCYSASAKAGVDFANVETSVQFSYALKSSEDKALGYGAASNQLETLRVQNDSTWRYGNLFFLYDYLHSNQPLGGPVFGPENPAAFSYGPGNSTYFLVGESELLGSKLFNYAQGSGLFQDWGLSVRIERGGYYKFHAEEIGPSVHLNVPGFDNFRLAAWRRWKSDISGSAGAQGFDVGTRTSYRPSWLLGLDLKSSWEMWGYKWSSQTFVRYQVGDGGKAGASGSENVNGIPARLWLEPDIFVHLSKNVAVGLRDYFLWQSDAIDNGYSTAGKHAHNVPQIVLKASF